MNRLEKAKKEAIKALKVLKQTLVTSRQKNAVDDLISQTELISESDPRFFQTMQGDHEAAFAAVEEEAGL